MGKRKTFEPQPNDWLFSCPATMLTEQIITVLGIPDQPVTEFSARKWDALWRMGNDILRAYHVPQSYEPGEEVDWDTMKERVLAKCHHEDGRFMGEFVIIRESRPEVASNLAFFVDVTNAYIQDLQKRNQRTLAKIVVVLAGWGEETLIGRIAGRHRIAYLVNSFPKSPRQPWHLSHYTRA
ncbi:MAG: hypothetical protein NVS2B12_29340 [Ktedonobacteraceae bacterium]